jgi:hypothetical protein
MPQYLTTQSTVQCAHGGAVTLFTANTKVLAGGAPVLLDSDQHIVAGCPFSQGSNYSPCVRVQWSAGATKSSAGDKPLLTTSVGIGYSAAGAPQGPVVVGDTQQSVEGL